MLSTETVSERGGFVAWVEKFSGLLIEGGVEGVEVFGVQFVLDDAGGLAEALVVDDLPLPEELDDVPDVGVVYQAEDVVVAHAGFLLCCNLIRTTFH